MAAVAASIDAVGEVTVSERKSNAAGPGAVHALDGLLGLGEGGGEVLGVVLLVSLVLGDKRGKLLMVVVEGILLAVVGVRRSLDTSMVWVLMRSDFGSWSFSTSVMARTSAPPVAGSV